jgi:hypothetical protein
MNGIVNNVIMLFIDVKVIDRATFPLKKYVSTPEVVPPGHEARIISPTLYGRGMAEKYETINARTGKMIICDVSPISNGLGKINISLKLAYVSDKPTPSIIRPRIKLRKMSINE